MCVIFNVANIFQILCLSPTYELAIQTGEVAAHMAKFCPEIEMKYAVREEQGVFATNQVQYLNVISSYI